MLLKPQSHSHGTNITEGVDQPVVSDIPEDEGSVSEIMINDIKEFLEERKAFDISIVQSRGPQVAGGLIVVSALSTRHAHALGRELKSYVKSIGYPPSNQGRKSIETAWVCIDLDRFIVHIFGDVSMRRYYDVENAWGTKGQGSLV